MGTCVLSQTQPDKQRFLRAVEILSHAVHAQANGTMDEYFPKAVLAKKIEVRGSRSAGVPGAVGGVSPGGLRAPLWLFHQMLILEEASELLTSNVRQQAMLCVVALRSLPAAPASGPRALRCPDIRRGREGDFWAGGGRARGLPPHPPASRGGGVPSSPPVVRGGLTGSGRPAWRGGVGSGGRLPRPASRAPGRRPGGLSWTPPPERLVLRAARCTRPSACPRNWTW